jgi:hypothetical protein
VARSNTDTAHTDYYPPRARWYGRIFYLTDAVRRGLLLDRISLPHELKWRELAAGLFVPGLAVWFRGPREWGKAAMIAWAFLSGIFVIWLGYPAANVAFGLMISLHATGFIYYCSPILRGWQFRPRLIFTALVLLGIGLLLYLPVRNFVQNHLLMPLRNGNQVVIISAQRQPISLERGEYAAFANADGIFFGKIVGLGGDEVDSREVPKNHLLIRVQFLRRYYHGDFILAFAYRSDFVEQDVIVSPEDFVGKPFKRWFWRKQILP